MSATVFVLSIETVDEKFTINNVSNEKNERIKLTCMRRIRWIDIAKGIGIVLVVLGHCQISNAVLRIISTFHMPLFFFLAGYVYCPARYSFVSFCERRMKTIIWPYLVFTVISILASFARKLIGQNISFESIFSSFIQAGIVESNPPLWFLRSLFVVEILFFFYQKIQKNNWLDFAGIYLIALFAFALNWNFYMRSVNGFLFYALGYFAKESRVMEWANRFKVPVCLASLIIFSGACIYLPANFSIATNSLLLPFIVTTHSGILFVLTLSMCLESINTRVLEYLGKNSLVILCTHVLVKDVISVFLKIVLKNETFMDVTSNGYAVLTTVAICIGSCFAAAIINRYCPFLLGKTSSKSKVFQTSSLT